MPQGVGIPHQVRKFRRDCGIHFSSFVGALLVSLRNSISTILTNFNDFALNSTVKYSEILHSTVKYYRNAVKSSLVHKIQSKSWKSVKIMPASRKLKGLQRLQPRLQTGDPKVERDRKPTNR